MKKIYIAHFISGLACLVLTGILQHFTNPAYSPLFSFLFGALAHRPLVKLIEKKILK